jgi:hypothetical protein
VPERADRRGWARDESPDWQPIPLGSDMRPLGDLARQGPGAYSLHAGERPRDDRARRLAARWSARALDGRPPRRLGAFRFRSEDAGYGALLVRGTRIGGGRRDAEAIAFVFRAH